MNGSKTGDAANLQRARGDQRGQSMLLVMAAIIALLGAAALAVDTGRIYYAYQQLQASTQAAALAGASVLGASTAADAISAATNYSGTGGNLNAQSNLNATMVAGYPQVKCLTSISLPCSASPANANAIVVQQQATVPATFARVLGFSTFTIKATATASARGGYTTPYNVAIILDTTASMNSNDNDSLCGKSRLNCAKAGIQILLQTLSPCPLGLSSCGTASTDTATAGANVANPVDEVGLYVFPGLTSTTEVPKDYTCPSQNPATTHYNNGPVYQVIAFSSDYRVSDTAPLNTSSDLVTAVGGASCGGVAAPGGQGTFYAGAIDAAQAALVANSRPNTRNALIILSDGDANASQTQMGGVASSYPNTQECHQAITAAQNASAAGTIVYSVAYGATSSGCSTDTNPPITPCQTMEQIASSPQNFFSDYTASGGSSSCVSASRPVTGLNEIFKQIGEDLTVARLIPNNSI